MINPILKREIRTLMRLYRSFLVVGFYVLIQLGIMFFVLKDNTGSIAYQGFHPSNTVGLYIFLFGSQLAFILIMTPIIAGSSISGERERQTLDLMLITKMSSFNIIVGKLLSSIAMVVLILISSLPVFAIVMYYGGITFIEILEMAIFCITSAIFAAAISIYFSARYKKTIVALVISYLVLLAFCFFGITADIFVSRIFNFNLADNSFITALYSLNPFVGYLSLVDVQTGNDMVTSLTLDLGYEVGIPFWIKNIVCDLLVSLVAIFGAAYFLKPSRSILKKNS